MTSSTLPPDAEKKTIKYLERLGRLNLLMGVITAQDHKKAVEQQRKNREAEEAAVRKHAWGYEDSGGGEEDDEMGDKIYLGDIREEHRHEVVQQPNSSPLKNAAIGAALAAAGMGVGAAGTAAAGLAGYGLYQALKPAGQEFVDTDTDTDTQYDLQIFREQGQ